MAHFIFIDGELARCRNPDSSTYPDLNLRSLDGHGINPLNASASAQFNIKNFSDIIKIVPKTKKILVIDLRQESHGLADGEGVFWAKDFKNDTNQNLSLNQILKDEQERLHTLKASGKARDVISEQQFIESKGFLYKRLPVTDHHRPSDQAVDEFINLVKTLPKDVWIHLHCKGGKGRTTTFAICLDIIKNYRLVSVEDIIKRHFLLSDFDLNKINEDFRKESALERLHFVHEFYRYARETNFEISWSIWIRKRAHNTCCAQ